MAQQSQVSDELKAAFELALKNRGISRAMSKWNLPAQVVGASLAVAWPLGAALGTVGIAGMVTTAGVIAVVGFINGKRESDAIATGDVTALGKYLTPDDVLEFEGIKQHLLSGGTELKKMGPQLGAETTTTQRSSCSDGIPGQGSGSQPPGKMPIPRAVARLDEAAPHLFMVGRTREGKSETLKHLIGTEQRVWYLTSKATDKVPSHWLGYRVGGPTLPLQVTWLLDQWEAAFLNHLEGVDKAREWFVIDEAVGILQSLKSKGAKGVSERLRGFVVELITAGAAVNALGGILSQTGNSGPLGIDLDLLQNFSCVACGKRKKPQMIKAFTKLTGIRVSMEQEQEILSLRGYWQLWENEGLCLSQVPLSKLPVKEVVVCPFEESNPESTQQDIKPPKPSFEARILDYLQKQAEGKTARDIARACTRSTDDPRPGVGQIKEMLALMMAAGQVSRETAGQIEKYWATGT